MPAAEAADVPLQPVRPDQGVAARGLPADRDRQAGAQPQPGERLRRGRAGRPSARRTSCPASARPRTRCSRAACSRYGDAHRYRVGVNADHLPVNRPHATEARTNSRTATCTTAATTGAKNYEPNSFGGPVQTGPPAVGVHRRHRWHAAPTRRPSHAEDDDFVQAGQPLPADAPRTRRPV